MATHVDHIVSKYQKWARNNPTYHYKPEPNLLQAAGPLEFISMDSFGTFSKTTQHNQHTLVIKDRYSKLSHAIPTFKATSSHEANLLFDNWLVLYGISMYLLTSHGLQFTSKSFPMICTLLGVKYLTTVACHHNNCEQIISKSFATLCSLHGVKSLTTAPCFPQPSDEPER